MTPMQEQYQKIKLEYPDYVVLFRLGDFFEAFDDDAITLSKVLGITLTGRGKDDNRKPMAGIPHHALKTYLPKLISEGIKVAIADQMEEATPGKIVDRQITKVITPGTIIDENSLESGKNNYIAAIFENKKNYMIAYSDISTGEFNLIENLNEKIFLNELNKISPKEILIQDENINTKININTKFEKLEKDDLNYELNLKKLKQHFKVHSLKSFGIDEDSKEKINILGALLTYLEKTQRTSLKHFIDINIVNVSEYMTLDPETIRNLELIYSTNGSSNNTLYSLLNECKTAMGKRLLANWLLHPLIKSEKIQQRLNCVKNFYENPRICSEINELLNEISDIQRISGRIGVNIAHPKDILGLKHSLKKSLDIIKLIETSPELEKSEVLKLLTNFKIQENIKEIIELIEKSISEDAPAIANEGNIIQKKYNSEVDELREIKTNSKLILAEIQKREIERTSISSLKISFNNVFGYYIEVTKTHLAKVPEDYIRKQTLANAERFITPELKDLETKILTAEDKLIKLEFALFDEIRQKLAEKLAEILEISNLISQIDIFAAFGYIARQKEYTMPTITQSKLLKIANGRHPIIETLVERFTQNDINFDSNNNIHILTGPNMSGKSTYIRQIAITALMAQIGSFVPASEMIFKPFDRIFTRVGASDNLAKGESTFMVEMTETSNILNNATKDSLIILDEVGRGTSTYDGVAIAWSIIEYINSDIKAFTLFATHYHELIALGDQYSNIKNFNVEVSENNGEVIFKHKIIQGGTNKSYGIHVAKLAGLPVDVIQKADAILKDFESHSTNNEQMNLKAQELKKSGNNKKIIKVPKPKKIHPEQIELI